MKHRYHVLAGRELLAATAFYEGQREGLGADFLDEIDKGIEVILQAPDRWPEMEPGLRKYRINRFPYALLYHRREADLIEILVVLDLRRDPGYWRDRLG